jgi:hypothetical protein
VLVSNPGGTHLIPNPTAGSCGRVAAIYYTMSYADRPSERLNATASKPSLWVSLVAYPAGGTTSAT